MLPSAFVRAVADRYEIERELDRGGSASVHLALERKHGRQVAIKVMHPELAREAGLQRFSREIEIAAQLSHPHIVPLLDSGEAAGQLYYVMPYVPGESLRARLKREKRLPVEEALRLAREIASALGYAHERGLIHRDVKPENVMLSDSMARVTDFGIARAPLGDGTAMTAVGTLIGTPAYMSPEQAAGGADLDARSDLYSLGCVLYEMLTGEPPFGGPAEGIVHQHLSVTPRPIREIRPEVPAAVSLAVAKALAKQRADRYETAAAFAKALAPPAGVPSRPRSVAVLPFLNLSADPENEYFADGITEDVIAQLSKIRTLKVISRTSVMPFKKREQSLREIGAKLEVATLLEGSVRRAGNRVRIVAQLIDVESDRHLWAETYDRSLTDIFVIQSDVALQIASALEAELSPHERKRMGKEPTSDVLAYQHYLRGRQCLIRFTAEELRKSIGHFQQAIERDPNYGLAYVGLSQAHTELGEMAAMDRAQAQSGAKSAALRALELDGELGEAHCALAYVRLVYEYDWQGAEREFKRALELSPGGADIYDLYGRLCSALGRHDEAIAMQQRSQELDPLAHRIDVATSLLRAGRYEEAARAAAHAVQLEPYFARSRATLGWALMLQGRKDEGLTELEQAVALSAGETIWKAQLGEAYGLAGKTERAREILRQLQELPAVSPYHLAYVHTGLGEPDQALDLLERAVEEGSGAAYGIRYSFLFAALRQHPRFVALLRKMRLDDVPPPA